MKIVDDVRYLGAQFGFHDGLPHVGWESKIDRFNQLVTRTGFLPLSAEGKAQIIAACPIAKIFYGCELTTLKHGCLKKMRTTVIRALWHGRSGRVPEVLMTLNFSWTSM